MELLQPSNEPYKPTVGEDFVLWAETYWRLRSKYSGTEENAEDAHYEAVKAIFIKKIDDLLRDRLQLH